MRITYKAFIIFICISVICLGALVTMYAWMLEQEIADPQVTGHLPLAKDAAINFMLLGLSLLIQTTSEKKNLIVFARILSVSVIIIAILSLLQNFYSAYDYTLVLISSNLYFGMAVQTAACFILLGAALFYIRHFKRIHIVQGVLHAVSCISLIVIVGHLLYIPHFYLLTFFSAMSVYSAIAFLLFSIAASLVNPTIGLTGTFTGKNIGNIMARRLTIRILIAMFLASYLLIKCYRNHWLGLDFAIAIFVIFFIMTTLFFIDKTSRVLNEIVRKNEMANQNFKAVFESGPNALVLADMRGNISLVNNQANILFGYNGNELIGKSLETVVPHRFRQAHRQKHPTYFKAPNPRHFNHLHDLYALRSDGTEIPVEIGLIPIMTEEGSVALASISDITERKKNEETINKQMTALTLRNQEMEQFSYIASHDLQEPLRTVLNYIELLQEDYPEQINGEISEHLGEMKSAIDRMSTLVRHLLDYGRLGQNKVLVETDTRKIVKDVLADLSTLIKQANATIEVDCNLPVLYAYETEVRQLFQNLINNAIKFRKSDVPPVITITCENKDGCYEFAISDNGIGIDPRHFPRIFLMFQRLNRHQDYSGYGVGLANCKKIVELHGGTIWVESKKDKGSTFKFTIAIIESNEQSN